MFGGGTGYQLVGFQWLHSWGRTALCIGSRNGAYFMPLPASQLFVPILGSLKGCHFPILRRCGKYNVLAHTLRRGWLQRPHSCHVFDTPRLSGRARRPCACEHPGCLESVEQSFATCPLSCTSQSLCLRVLSHPDMLRTWSCWP